MSDQIASAEVAYTTEDDGVWLRCPFEPCNRPGGWNLYRPAAFMETATMTMMGHEHTYYDSHWTPTVAELAAAEAEHLRDVHGVSQRHVDLGPL